MPDIALQRPHSVEIREGAKTVITGVAEVVSCEDELMEAELAERRIVLRGRGLRIESFESAKGVLTISGEVELLQYLKGRIKGVSILERIFR